jgi:hypothetical protein
MRTKNERHMEVLVMVVEVDLERNIAVRIEALLSMRGEVVCRIEAQSVSPGRAKILCDKSS